MLNREIACTIFEVFGENRPGSEPLPTANKASILPLGHGRGKRETWLIDDGTERTRSC